MGYIAFNNPLNLVFDSEVDTDILANAAGGLNDENLAGGSNYIATRARLDYDHIFLKGESPSLTELLFMLGENFAEYALLQIQIMDSTPNKGDIIETFLKANILNEQAKQEALKEILRRSGWQRGILGTDEIGRILSGSGYFDMSRVIGSGGGISLGRLAQERYGDSVFENTLESIGNQIGGPALGALGGIIGSFLNGESLGDSIGLNLGEAMSDFMSNTISDLVVDKITGSLLSSATSALGTTAGTIGTLGVANLAAAAVKEAFEVVTGLDRHYGFGGDLIGRINGADAYLDNRNFMQGLKDMFGFNTGLETVLSRSGETLGFAYNGQITTKLDNGNFVSTISGKILKDYTNFDIFARTGYENFTDALRHNERKGLTYGQREFLKNEFERQNNIALRELKKELDRTTKSVQRYGIVLDVDATIKQIAPSWGQKVWDKVWGKENVSTWDKGLGKRVWDKVWGKADVSEIKDITYNLDRQLDFTKALDRTRWVDPRAWLAKDATERGQQINALVGLNLFNNGNWNPSTSRDYLKGINGGTSLFDNYFIDRIRNDLSKVTTHNDIVDNMHSWGDWAKPPSPSRPHNFW